MRFLQWLQRHVQEVLPAVPSGALCKSGKPDINGVYCVRCWVVLACLRSDGVCAVPERHLLQRDGPNRACRLRRGLQLGARHDRLPHVLCG